MVTSIINQTSRIDLTLIVILTSVDKRFGIKMITTLVVVSSLGCELQRAQSILLTLMWVVAAVEVRYTAPITVTYSLSFSPKIEK